MTGTPARGIAIPWIAAALIGLFAFDNILLWAFLGRLTPVLATLGVLGIGFLVTLLICAEPPRDTSERLSTRTVLICLALAAILLVFGGEGRFLYANFDWQVRDAVLADMGQNRWPFAYAIDGTAHVLRAPVGMYLFPALLGGASQTTRDLALLASNSVMFGLLLALAAALFPKKSRPVALAVFILFSGLDIVGTAIVASKGGNVSFDHIERWIATMQYSSTITQIFWVPQHAIAGWAGAVLYILWRRDLLGSGFFLSVIPLSALWSPLALLGMIPFAVLAAIKLLTTRRLTPALAAVGVISLGLAVPGLFYLTADAGRVQSGLQSVPLLPYVLFIALEVGLYLRLVWARRDAPGFDRTSFIMIAVLLLAMPFYHIGDGEDFMMRASIMPLALLAYFVTRCLCLDGSTHRYKITLMLILAIGAVTGLKETLRSVSRQPAPPPLCTLVDVWTQQGERISPIGIYVARVAALPDAIRPRSPVAANPSKARQLCWDRPWVTSR